MAIFSSNLKWKNFITFALDKMMTGRTNIYRLSLIGLNGGETLSIIVTVLVTKVPPTPFLCEKSQII